MLENRGDLNNQNEDGSNNPKIKISCVTFIKFFIMIVGLVTIIMNTFYGFALPHGNVNCLQDSLFDVTSDINSYLSKHSFMLHFLIAFSSICVDFVIIYMAIYWSLCSDSWRLIASLFAFYSFRGFVQVNFHIFINSAFFN
jgi:hypothetical protein